MKTYTLAELELLKAEFLQSISDDYDNEWYCSPRELASGEITAFFRWLNIKEHTPV